MMRRRSHPTMARRRAIDNMMPHVDIDEIDLETCDVSFEQPQWAVTPGQSVVLYDRDVCLGGGIIQ